MVKINNNSFSNKTIIPKNKKVQFDKGEIIIYETSKKEIDLKVRFKNESV